MVGENIKNFINKYQLVGENEDYFTEGMKQANGEATDTVLGGTFNDKMELPKDPIKFNQWGLIGYEDSSHLGGSYLMAQKIDLKWDKLLTQKIHWESIIGRKDREDNDTIFPQSWCPHSHIKSSRIKDEFGNPVTMARQSKPYFDEEPQPGKLERERGIFFCGYLRSAKLIVELSQNQCMNGDKLLNYFNALQGGILYVPNLV